MSVSPLVSAIQSRLRFAGYRDISTPLKIAGVELEFTGAMRGREGRALDLVLIIDTTTGDFGDRDAVRVRQRVEALSRALDVTGSRFVVTAILAGAVLAENIASLSETCRVLQVEAVPLNVNGQPADDAAILFLDDRIRVLLPLTTSGASALHGDNRSAMEELAEAVPIESRKALLEAVVAASDESDQAVTDAAASLISKMFANQAGEDAP